MGRFNGLTDVQWQVIEFQLPKYPEKRWENYPHAPHQLSKVSSLPEGIVLLSFR